MDGGGNAGRSLANDLVSSTGATSASVALTDSERARVLRRFVTEHGEALEDVACPLCGGLDRAVLFEGGDLLYGKPGSYPVVRCGDCEMQFVSPRPTFEALGAHYPDEYFCYVSAEEGPAALRPILRNLERSQALRRLRHIEKAIGRIEADATIVDVGCGLNLLLQHIKESRGAVGIGVDLKETMVERATAMGMPIAHGTLVEAGLETGRFDLVTMIEYLEHEREPLGVLAEARRVLKPGGHLAIEIPNIEGLPARMFKSRWSNLDVPRHLVFFDRKTLTRALETVGFELVAYETFSMPMYFGLSVMLWLGRRNIMRNLFVTQVLAGFLGAPFVPALPWLPEFTFAVARARPAEGG